MTFSKGMELETNPITSWLQATEKFMTFCSNFNGSMAAAYHGLFPFLGTAIHDKLCSLR